MTSGVRPRRSGTLLVVGTLVVAGLAVGAGVALRSWVSQAPRALARALRDYAASADADAYGAALGALFARYAEFRVFDSLLPLPRGARATMPTATMPASRPGDDNPLLDERTNLLKLCRQGEMTMPEADLLLAILLDARGYGTAAARLLELLHTQGQATPGSRRLLAAIYAARGASAATEPAQRDPVARW